jgi:hypothetical protein
MRRLALLLLLAASMSALAQVSGGRGGAPPGPPGGLQPLPEPPPMPPESPNEPEPEVTIVQRGEQTIEEYRYHGRLYAMKVTTAAGLTYFLVDQRGDGVFARQDHLDTGLRVPQWLILRF